MLDLEVGYKTGAGTSLSLRVYGQGYKREEIPLFYPKEELISLCGNCKGYSGGCPGYAPYFDDIKPSMPYFYVISVWMDMAWAIKYAGKLDYFRSSYTDRLTQYYILRVVRRIENVIDSFGLMVGGCSACKASNGCSVLLGQPCVNPSRRTYSVEAVGVDCSELHRLMFGVRLPYWYYGQSLQRYMTRYAGLYVRSLDGLDEVLAVSAAEDQSFALPVEPVPAYRLVTLEAPSHTSDAGMKYEAYEKDEDGNYIKID